MLKRGLGLFVAVILGCADVIDAQEQKKIGILSGGSAESTSVSTEAFRKSLQELGWNEGRNIVTEYRYANGQLRQLPEFASQLVSNKMDVIVAQAPAAVRAAKNVTTSIPIVMAHGATP